MASYYVQKKRPGERRYDTFAVVGNRTKAMQMRDEMPRRKGERVRIRRTGRGNKFGARRYVPGTGKFIG